MSEIVTQVRTFQRSLETYGWGEQRLAATIFAVYAGTALALAATGIYGVVSFAVTQQKRSLGIRLALGATTGVIAQLVLRSTAEMLVVGVIAGSILTAILSPIVSSWSGGSLSDPLTVAASGLIMLVTAAIACAFPAWRAASVDPMEILRVE